MAIVISASGAMAFKKVSIEIIILEKKNMELFTGIGTFESRTGTYIGSWKSGLQNGNGTAIYHNGNRYDGQFKDGFKHGFGKFAVTTIGDVYTGHFERGMRHGHVM